MSEIRIKENESIDSALRRFKRSCAKAGTLSELRKREHYESPSVKRKRVDTCGFHPLVNYPFPLEGLAQIADM